MSEDDQMYMNPLADALVVQCVHCFEFVDIVVDPHDRGTLIQDCDVCCGPLQITISWMPNGQPQLQIESGN